MNKIYFMEEFNIDPSTKCGNTFDIVALNKKRELYGLQPYEHKSSNNSSKEEYIIPDSELSLIFNRLDRFKAPAPSDAINNIIEHAHKAEDNARYKRLCWQLGLCLGGAMIIDIALIIWLIRLAS